MFNKFSVLKLQNCSAHKDIELISPTELSIKNSFSPANETNNISSNSSNK